MKKFLIAAVVFLTSMTVNAQNEAGRITVAPVVGVNFASVSMDHTKSTVGLAVGVNGEYGLSEKLGISAGLMYSMQGYKMDGYDEASRMNYLSLPVLANYYVWNGLAVKAGIQPAFLLSAKYDGESFKDDCNSFDFAIPVGVSYQFSNLVVDARYNIGVTNTSKGDGDVVRNGVISVTLGWRFKL